MKLYGSENNMFIIKEIGTRIRDARVAMPLTRKELSEKSGVSLSTIERIESGSSISFDNMLSIFRVLHMLSNVDALVPEFEMSPVDIAKGKSKRKRATSQKGKKKVDWIWGDEK